MDSDLVFPTEPNSTYWVTGHVQAKIINATGDPGVTYTVLHTGDSLALASRTQLGSAFVAPTNTSTGIELTPFDLTRIGTYPWPRATPVVNQILSMFPDFTIVTGATGGECGIGWGLYDLGAAGSTALLAGSFLYVRRLGV